MKIKTEDNKGWKQEVLSIAITVAVATVFNILQKKVRNKITDYTGK